MNNNVETAKLEQYLSGICLFSVWLIGITVCIDKKQFIIGWVIICTIITISFLFSIYAYLKNKKTNENSEIRNISDIENPRNIIKQIELKPIKIFCKQIPEDYTDVCPICLEKLESDTCTISDCQKHFYHIKCIDNYIEKGFTECSICKK